MHLFEFYDHHGHIIFKLDVALKPIQRIDEYMNNLVGTFFRIFADQVIDPILPEHFPVRISLFPDAVCRQKDNLVIRQMGFYVFLIHP